MKILIVAATEFEVSAYHSKIKDDKLPVDIIITGAGMVPTAFKLGQHFATAAYTYDLIINVGIAGSFRRDIRLGAVVRINKDQFSELGAEDGDDFLTFEDIGLGESQYVDKLPETFERYSSISKLESFKGVTVNTVHGNSKSIETFTSRVDADLESMEGAAVFYVANALNIPVLQVRSISNYVETRNRDSWDVRLAITNLNNWLLNLTKDIYD
ncbi:futalosine hydrolase [Albibacterium profundi]|uniref:Futalosine hydrolase n=1 Tax=Albibacterium profundi TaxID=3134906 RepID=A0ABV5CD75_9SPHI